MCSVRPRRLVQDRRGNCESSSAHRGSEARAGTWHYHSGICLLRDTLRIPCPRSGEVGHGRLSRRPSYATSGPSREKVSNSALSSCGLTLSRSSDVARSRSCSSLQFAAMAGNGAVDECLALGVEQAAFGITTARPIPTARTITKVTAPRIWRNLRMAQYLYSSLCHGHLEVMALPRLRISIQATREMDIP